MLRSNVSIQILIFLSLLATWSSQTLLDLCTVIMFLVLVSQKNFTSFLKTTLQENKAPILLFTGYFLISVLGYAFNARPGAEIENLRKFDWILLYLVLYMAFKSINGKLLPDFVDRIKYLIFIPAVYGFSIFFTANKDFLTGRLENDSRIVGMVNSPTYHAHIGVVFFAVSLILITENRRLTPTNLFISGVIALSTLLTRTRGALMALIAGLAAYGIALLYKKRILTKTKVIILGLIALIVALLPAILIKRADSTNCREVLIATHLNMVKANPLLGIGYRDNLRSLEGYSVRDVTDSICGENGLKGNQAHNQFLNVAATTGLLGLLFFICFYFLFYAKIFKLFFDTGTETADRILIYCIFTVITIFTAASMFEVMFEFAKIRYMIIICWAFTQNLSVKYDQALKSTSI